MTASGVTDNVSGKSTSSSGRTSTGMFFGKAEDDVIRRIEKRVAQVTMLPVGERTEALATSAKASIHLPCQFVQCLPHLPYS